MAASNVEIAKDDLHDWIMEETRALDVVASWETLCDVYRTLEFSDQLSDAVRMEEFKWIVAEMNKHLSRSRKKLLSCKDPDSTRESLAGMFTSTGTQVRNRMDLTYHKLRQMWVRQMLAKLDAMMETKEDMENGRTDFWND